MSILIRLGRSALCTAAAVLALTGGAAASVLTAIDPTVYGFVTDTNNDGIADGVNANFLSVASDLRLPRQDRGIAEFDVSAFDGAIISATLHLFASNFAGFSSQIVVYGSMGDGSIDPSDYLLDGSLFLTSFVQSAATDRSLDVTGFVQSLIDADADFARFQLTPNRSGTIFAAGFGSLRDGTNAVLKIEVVPVPATLPLLLGAVGAFAIARRRRSSAA